jgi:16S rRNA C1402 N4-methylase RsmH
MERGALSGHLPVMYAQVLDGLDVRGSGTYLDGTFGRGGHARGVLERLGPGGRLLLMDKDPEAIAVAMREFAQDARVAVFRGSFAELAQWDETAAGLDGVLFDLGVSSPQLDVAERGFSFGKDGPLDMRMDPDSGESAAQKATDEETSKNPRARSAVLRVAEKLGIGNGEARIGSDDASEAARPETGRGHRREAMASSEPVLRRFALPLARFPAREGAR